MRIRAAQLLDGHALAAIYNHFVAHTVVTFEEEPVTDEEMSRRLGQILALPLPWLVAVEEGAIVGYAYASRWKGRRSYRFSAEATVYVHPDHGRRGIGSALYEAMLPLLADAGIHAVMGGISLPNAGSVSLHEKFGFVHVATFKEVAFKFGAWVDVGYWERVL